MHSAVVLDAAPVIITPELTLGEAIRQMQSQKKAYFVAEKTVFTPEALLQLLSEDPQRLTIPLSDLPFPQPDPDYHLIWDPQGHLKGVLIAAIPPQEWHQVDRALAWVDRDLRLWHCNPTWTAWLGSQWQDRLALIPWAKLLQEPQPHWHQEHLLTTQDHQSRYVLTQVSGIGDPEPTGFALEMVDISRDKERELLHATLFESIPDLMVKVNRRGERTFFRCGRGFRIYAHDLSFDLSKTIYDVLPPDLAQERMDYVHRALDSQTTQVYEYIIEIDGKQQWEEARIIPCSADEAFLLIRDITAEKHARIQQQQQYQRLQLLNAITRSIRQSLHLDTILTTAVQEVRALLQTDRVIIYQFDANWVGTITAESVSDPQFSLLGETIADPCLANDWHHSYRQGRISRIADIHTSPLQDCHRQLLSRYQVRANLVVPILLNESCLWGLLIAHHCTGPYAWDEWKVDLLTDLAQQLAIAIQQTQIHRRLEMANSALRYQVNIRNAELQNLLDYEKLLRTITDSVRSNLDEKSLLQKTITAMVEGLGLKDCLVALFTDETHTTHLITSASDPQWEGLTLELDPLVRNHFLNKRSAYFSTHHPYAGPVTVVAAPIYDQEKLLGFLQLVRLSEDTFSTAEIRLAEQVANQCAIGIRQARLYQASLEQVRRLEELNRLKDEFVHMVSHELRTPLTNMNMALKMIEIQGLQESQQRYFQILRSEWNRELNLVNELLELQALESGTRGLALSTVELPKIIQKVTAPFLLRTQERQQQFQVFVSEQVGEWISDSSLLERVILELLNNACKYTPADHQISMKVEIQGTNLVITVANTGVEIPLEVQGKIFDKFFRLSALDHWNQGGTGLGLSLVSKAVEILGGKIHLESQAQRTTFQITLPPLAPASPLG